MNNNYLNELLKKWKLGTGITGDSPFLHKESVMHNINNFSGEGNTKLTSISKGPEIVGKIAKPYLDKTSGMIDSAVYNWVPTDIPLITPIEANCKVIKVSSSLDFIRFLPSDETCRKVVEGFQYDINMGDPIRVNTLGVIIMSSAILIGVMPIIKWKLRVMMSNFENGPTQEQINLVNSLPDRILNIGDHNYTLTAQNISMLHSNPDSMSRFIAKRVMHKGIEDIPSSAINEIKLMSDHAQNLKNAVTKFKFDNELPIDLPRHFLSKYKWIVDDLFHIKVNMQHLVNNPSCNRELSDVGLLPLYEKELRKLHDIAIANCFEYVDVIGVYFHLFAGF